MGKEGWLVKKAARRAPVPKQVRSAYSQRLADEKRIMSDDDAKTKEIDVCADGFVAYVKKSVHALLFENALNLLMLGFPIAVFGSSAGWSDGAIFGLSLVAIAPFAERLSFVTEQLALHTSQLLVGLLNATFGNVTELIVSFFALR